MKGVASGRTDARALAHKYETLLELRDKHSRGQPPASKASLASLAARFPGALAELDLAPSEVLSARRDVLNGRAEGAIVPAASQQNFGCDWVAWMADFHDLLRVGLFLKAGRRAPPTPLSLLTPMSRLAFDTRDLVSAPLAQALVSAPQMKPVVLGELARRYQVSQDSLRDGLRYLVGR